MKTILIATDFSRASRNASIYGVQFARAINANVILFNAFRLPVPTPALSVSISRYDIMMQTDKLLLDEGDLLDPKRELIEVICDEGLAEDAILNIANEKMVDFIIAGMKGSGKNLKKILGSTATSLAQNTNIPVIIVPENAEFKNPDIIIFANDSSIDSDKEIPEKLKAIRQLFQSKLYIAKVIKNNNEEWFKISDTPQESGKVAYVPDTSFAYPVDSDVRHALNEFIQKHDANMLVMMPHKHGWLEHLFRKSETKDMILHTKIPLLVLPEVNSEIRFASKKELQNKTLA
jgi:nucleotide-binding universal stress UspA family protein